MTVTYLLGSLSRGGTETLVLDVFKNADKAAYKFIGIHRKDGQLKDEFYATTPEFIKCPIKHKNLITYFKNLRNILKTHNVQIVHAQQMIDAIFAHFACIGTNIKVVETFHGYDFGNSRINQYLTKKSMQWSNGIIFVSEAERQYYLNKYGHQFESKSYVVYNGVNFSKIIPRCPNTDPSHKLQMGAVGNFVVGRNQMVLCEFLNLLNQQGVDFDFYFVGRRSDAEPWRYDNCVKYCKEHKISEKVHFLGSRNDVPELLSRWDAFLYSTDHDTFGIAVVEAIAAGLPTFVNDWEVMSEITGNGQLAHLYKTKDAKDLLSVFMQYLDNKATYEAQAKYNASVIQQKFSIEQHIKELSKVYSSVLKQ